jgi:DNA-binding response OmpR family regulator
LETSAGLLVECLETERAQRFLGCGPGPERRTDEAPPQTGHLGLILDDSERTVRRQGRAECVQFGDAELGWKLLRALVRAGEVRLSLPDLRREVWGSDALVEDNTVHKLASLLRAALKPIGLDPRPLRKLGYRLESVSDSE